VTSFLIVALLLAQRTATPEMCTISGIVADALTGLPLGKAEVVAEHVGSHDPGASTTTDARGNFLMIEIDPGQYRLSVKRSGYLETHYGAKRPSGTGTTLTLTTGQKIEDLTIKLTPFGVIAGTVRDSDGEPMADVTVGLLTVLYSAGRRRVQWYDSVGTDDLGQYRIANLEPGKYYVSAEARSRDENLPLAVVDHSAKSENPPEFPIQTFYPGTADPSAARPIELAAGARLTGVDIAFIRSPVHRVAVHIDALKGLVVSASLNHATEGFGEIGRSRPVGTGGDVEISGVPPGSYVMRISAYEPGKPFDGTIDLFGRNGCDTSVPLSVGRDDVADVRVVAAGCAEVEGHIAFEGDKKPQTCGGDCVAFDEGLQGHNAFLKPDGSFRLLLSPGHHSIDLAGMQNGFYVRSIRSGNQDVLRNGFTAASSEHVELEVVLASDGGHVEGSVSDADDKPVGGATVVLIPNDPGLRPRLDYTRVSITDQTGHYELKSAAPGEYRLFAWDDIDKDSWLDPDVMKDYEAKGEPVIVKVKDSQTVKLHVIP
jgi:protocatechuate 3,4-dioxygenase beta subunit